MKALRPFFLLLLVCASLLSHAQNAPAARDTANDLALLKTRPEFPGGQQAMYRWLGKKVHYPNKAYKKKIHGKVYVQFVVEKDGRIGRVTLRRGCDPLLDKEALRVIGKMPAWKPGRLEDGTAVATRFTVPIDFKLDERRPGED